MAATKPAEVNAWSSATKMDFDTMDAKRAPPSTTCSVWRGTLVAMLMLLAYVAVPYPSIARADSPVLVLNGTVTNDAMSGHVDAFVDEDWSKTPKKMIGEDAGLFKPISAKQANFGYTKSKIWFRLRLQNETTDIDEWRLYFAENFKQIFDVWAIRQEEAIENIMSLDSDSRFSDRAVVYPELTAPVKLKPGESATILVSLWSEGSSYVEFSMMTADDFAELASRNTAKNFVFYGMMIILIAVALASLLVFRQVIFAAYSAYAASALLYVMHADGTTFQYLWPDWPAVNSMASVYAGSGIIIFGAIYSTIFLRTRERHPVLHVILLAVIAVTLGMIIVLLPISPQILKKALVMMSLVAIITFTVSAIVAARKRFREVRFYLFAWVGATMSAFLLNMNHIFAIDIGQDTLYDSMRGVMVFDAAMMGLAIADRYNQLRTSRQRALTDSLDKANLNIELNTRLNELEQKYLAATELSKIRNEQMENTVHDLRQPIHALRLNIGNLLRKQSLDPDEASGVENTFTYLESLVTDYLVAPGSAGIKPPISHDVDDEAERLSVSEVLKGVHEMFIADAEEKGLRFDFDENASDSSVDSLVLMRIVSNLVSNAIKYTENGFVRLSSTKQDGALVIRITDSGPGISRASFEEACKRYVRLKDVETMVEGQGLGLAIAHDLAQRHNIEMRLTEQSKTGSVIEILVPGVVLA